MKAQARFNRRAEQRRMIENELEKGFEDLSTARVHASLGRIGKGNDYATVQSYASNEMKWGVWRPYLVEDTALLNLCEDYRQLARTLRMQSVVLKPAELSTLEQQTDAELSAKAREIVALLNKQGW